MNDKIAIKQRWGMFRLEAIEPLLRGAVKKGELKQKIQELSELEYRHPLHTGRAFRLSYSTIEGWYYQAKDAADPVAALTGKVRSCTVKPYVSTNELFGLLARLHASGSRKTVRGLYLRLAVVAAGNPQLGTLPSYRTVLRWVQLLQDAHRVGRRRVSHALASSRMCESEHRDCHQGVLDEKERSYTSLVWPDPLRLDPLKRELDEEDCHHNPIEAVLADAAVTYPLPDIESVTRAYPRLVTRTQCNGIVTVQGLQYKVPLPFMGLSRLLLRYSEWDLSHLILLDPDKGTPLARLLARKVICRTLQMEQK